MFPSRAGSYGGRRRGNVPPVQVDPQDCNALRLLWWPNNDLNEEPVDYQMQSEKNDRRQSSGLRRGDN